MAQTFGYTIGNTWCCISTIFKLQLLHPRKYGKWSMFKHTKSCQQKKCSLP